MDQRTSGVEMKRDPPDGERESSPRAAAEALSGEVAAARDGLDTLVAELDRRRHNVLDVRLQLRRHALGVILTTAAFVIAAAGFVWLDISRRRERERVTSQAGRLRQAVSRMIDRPERVAAEPTIAGRIVAAAASAAVASLVKKLLERGVERLMTQPDDGTRPRSVTRT